MPDDINLSAPRLMPSAGSSSAEMPRLVAGTLASLDLNVLKRFCEEFLGFDCVRYAPGKMLIRDQYSKAAMQAGSDDYFVIDATQVSEIVHPQSLLNHWGMSVSTVEEVDRIHAIAKARKEEFGFRKVQKITTVHGSYQFYFSDADQNWWEIECRIHGLNNRGYFAQGDVFTDNV